MRIRSILSRGRRALLGAPKPPPLWLRMKDATFGEIEFAGHGWYAERASKERSADPSSGGRLGGRPPHCGLLDLLPQTTPADFGLEYGAEWDDDNKFVALFRDWRLIEFTKDG